MFERMMAGVLTAWLLLTIPAHAGNSPVGFWKTINEDTNEVTSVVEIRERSGELYGVVLKLINNKYRVPKCTDCEGEKKNKKVEGMEILWGLSKDDDEWSGGTILDPGNGKEYSCYVKLEDGGIQLYVRAYIGISLLGRSQYWKRTKRPARMTPKK